MLRERETRQEAAALALLSLEEKGESRCFDVMDYGKGEEVLGRIQVSWKNWHIPDGGSGCPSSWNHSSMVVEGSPLLMGAEVSGAADCLGPGGCCRLRWK